MQPSLVLSVETEELGIAAGLQDRVVQVYGGLVFMDFSRDVDGRSRTAWRMASTSRWIRALLPPLYVAYSEEAGEPTEVLHNNLRARFDQGDADVVDAMRQFAELAQQARDAPVRRAGRNVGPTGSTGTSICADRSASCRANHVRMVEVARRVGASAKFAGSGGAIVGVYEDDAMFERLVRELGTDRLPGLQADID